MQFSAKKLLNNRLAQPHWEVLDPPLLAQTYHEKDQYPTKLFNNLHKIKSCGTWFHSPLNVTLIYEPTVNDIY